MVKFNLIFILFLFSSTIINAQKNMQYTLSMPNPHSHIFEVEMAFDMDNQDSILLYMPTWAPGSYLIREFPKNVITFKAWGNQNQELAANKINKHTWRVATKGVQQVKVRYSVYAFEELSVRTSYLDIDHGYVNGTSVFMYADEFKEQPCKLNINLYKDWKKISTGLTKENGSYIADNYDQLVDSPIEMGNHQIYTFEATGVEHELAIFGAGNYDVERLKMDITKIAEACTATFGENPNKRFVFIIHNTTKRGGGLEHFNSTTLNVDRWTYAPQENYNKFISLVSHEYFHLWFVKRIRPINLGPFDYQNEVYTKLLWVFEGITSYYDELLLIKAGLWDEQTYLTSTEEVLNKKVELPGLEVQSVAEASFDSWIKHYRPNENKENATVSYYSKGAAIAMLLDLEIIKRSKGKRNLDVLLRKLYQFYKTENRGITEQELQHFIEDILGSPWPAFFNDYVYGTKPLDYQKHLGYVGLEMINQNEGVEVGWGFDTTLYNNSIYIKHVHEGSSFYQAGIYAFDELIAIDHFRIDPHNLDARKTDYKVGDELTVTVARDRKLLDIPVKLVPSTLPQLSIRPKPKITSQEAEFQKVWLHRKLD